MLSTTTLDGGGFTGEVFHYAFILFLVSSAFIIFFYLWRKGRLDMDEAPKHQMLEDDDFNTEERP